MNRWLWRLATLVVLSVIIARVGLWQATRTPVVRHYVVRTPAWPADMRPIRIAFLTDIHVAGPDMPPTR